jgi:periplasmic protein TonB
MNPIFHTLHIATLATWLSVAGFGTVGVLVPAWQDKSVSTKMEETKLLKEDFTLGDTAEDAVTEGAAPELAADNPPETLPSPPELPALAEQESLPEIPDLPDPEPTPTPKEQPIERPVKAKPSISRASNSQPSRPVTPSGSTTSKTNPAQKPTNGIPGGKASAGKGIGLSDSARIAAGQMPRPPYPSEARRRNQTGTVVIEYTVDESGRVISAYVKSSSGWPSLDQVAVRTILQKWKFPRGNIMKKTKPIIFRLE